MSSSDMCMRNPKLNVSSTVAASPKIRAFASAQPRWGVRDTPRSLSKSLSLFSKGLLEGKLVNSALVSLLIRATRLVRRWSQLHAYVSVHRGNWPPSRPLTQFPARALTRLRGSTYNQVRRSRSSCLGIRRGLPAIPRKTKTRTRTWGGLIPFLARESYTRFESEHANTRAPGRGVRFQGFDCF